MVFFDSSALFKRYGAEAGSEKVIALLAKPTIPLVSRLTYAEILSILARKRRTSHLDEEGYQSARRDFLGEWPRFNAADLRMEILEQCKTLIDVHALTGADAVQLATALEFRARLAPDLLFVSADDRLLRAARGEGLRILNPESSS